MKSETENQTLGKFPHEIKTIPIAEIITGNNPRYIDAKGASIKDLAENIKATGGVLQPVIVRVTGNKAATPPTYELLAGGRRVAASKLAGFTEIKAAVYDVDDEEARLISVTENLHREGLTPLEEAKAFKTLLDTGKNPEVIAAELGRSLSFVLRRARLLSLTPEWLDALAGKEPPKHIKALASKGGWTRNFDKDTFIDWPVAAMEMIARYDAEMQNFILAELSYKSYNGADSIQGLEKFLSELTHQIKKAPWPISDASLLPKVGACDTCPKRSSHNPGLFEDDLTPEKVTAVDKCLDIQCWESKMKAHMERRIVKLQTDHANLVKISNDYNNKVGIHGREDWHEAQRTDKNARPAIVMDGPAKGQLKWVTIGTAPRQKTARPKGKDGKPVAASKEDRYKKLADRRNAHAVEALRKILASDDPAKNYPKFASDQEYSIKALAALIPAFGVEFRDFQRFGNEKDWDVFDKYSKAAEQQLMFTIWRMIAQVFIRRLFFNTAEGASATVPEAKKICKLLQIKFEDLLLAAEADIPVPKSWAKLDGEEKPKAEKKPAADNPKKAAKPKAESSGKAKAKKVKRGSLLKKK